MRLYSYTKGKIGGRDLGLKWHPLRLCTKWYLYRQVDGKYDKSQVDREICFERAQTITDEPGPTCLDIEEFEPKTHWEQTEHAFRTAVEIYRAVNPHHRIGIYRYLPGRDYWTPVLYRKNPQRYKDRYEEWAKHNSQWLSDRDDSGNLKGQVGIADLVDVVYPSLYAFYPNIDDNLIYMEENLIQAGQYEKPVIPWMWTQFNNSTESGKTGGDYVGDQFLRRQLKLIQRMSDERKVSLDGIIFFNGDTGHLPESALEVLREFFPKRP